MRRELSPSAFDDFDIFENGAVYVYEKKSKRKAGAKGKGKGTTSTYKANLKKYLTGSQPSQGSGNPLSKYLGDELNFDPPVQATDGHSSGVESDEIPEPEYAEKSRAEKRKGPLVLKPNTRNIYEGSSDEEALPSSSSQKRAATDDSQTTSSKRRKLSAPTEKTQEIHAAGGEVDDSETEPESVTEEESVTDAESVTEPESDEDETTLGATSKLTDAQIRADWEAQERDAVKYKARPKFETERTHPWRGPLCLDEEQEIAVPGSINRYLRNYQREGVKFFYDRWKEGRGGILGDDMGLGKTIQVIAFLSAIMEKHGDKRDKKRRYNHVRQLQEAEDWRETIPPANASWPTCLIIAPATVVHNWDREFKTWGYFECAIYGGAHRKDVMTDFKLGRLDVLIASFETTRSDIDYLDTLAFSCVIVDEAHRIKNPNSQTTIAFNQFNCQARFGLTGTAIQNDYAELWTLLDWSNPGRLGTTAQWKTSVTDPLKVGQSQAATDEELAIARTLAARLVQKLLPEFFLRRTKRLIQDQMPKKQDQVLFCPLTQEQIRIYRLFLHEFLKDKESKGRVLKFISIFIKVSNHVALILPAPKDTPEQTKRNREYANIAFPDEYGPPYGIALFDETFCGKWKVLLTLLQEWHRLPEERNKVLVFSRSVKLIDMLEFYFKREGYNHRKLDGNTKQSERMDLVDNFNLDPDVFIFLISTVAGGTGLNLTAANKVVLFDPNWNPAHDLQAIDRAFRIGQVRDVQVFRLLAAGSIEEKIYQRQVYKQQQMAIGYDASVQTRFFDGVQGHKGKEGSLFGLKNLISLDEASIGTKDTIETTHQRQFNWALANLDAGSQSQGSDGAGPAFKEDHDMEGLGHFLYDDEDAPALDEVQKILNSLGVEYSHYNEELLKPSHVEAKVTEKAIKKHQRRKVEAARAPSKSKDTKAKEPVKQWPPIRTKRPIVTPDARLKARKDALVALGYITGRTTLEVFIPKFILKTEEEQLRILRDLDNWTENQGR